MFSRNFKNKLIFHVSLTIVIIDSRFWRTFPRSFQVVDTAPDDVYEKLAARLFFCPLEAVLWYVPSYQLTDVSDLFWAMKLRSRQIFGRSINEGRFEYFLKMLEIKTSEETWFLYVVNIKFLEISSDEKFSWLKFISNSRDQNYRNLGNLGFWKIIFSKLTLLQRVLGFTR